MNKPFFAFNRAFTLSEVLIVIGVIGVVATLIMQPLIHWINAKKYSSQLQTAVAILDAGYQSMLAEDGATRFEDTSVYANLQSVGFDKGSYNDTGNVEATAMQKYFKAVVTVPYAQQVAEGWPGGGTSYTGDVCKQFVGKGSAWYSVGSHKSCKGYRQNVYKLLNGMLIRATFFDGNKYTPNDGPLKRAVGEVAVDVNGEQGPNYYGYDSFMFVLGDDGHIYPDYGTAYAKYYSALNSSDFYTYYFKNADGVTDRCSSPNMWGMACAGHVEANGWEIDYLK